MADSCILETCLGLELLVARPELFWIFQHFPLLFDLFCSGLLFWIASSISGHLLDLQQENSSSLEAVKFRLLGAASPLLLLRLLP